MQKPYMIRIGSTKGGVGKSVTAINLAVALQEYGYKTLIIDLDIVNPCVGLYLGMQDTNIGTLEVIGKQADLKRAIVPHAPTGLHVLQGRITYAGEENPDKDRITAFYQTLKGLEYDFIIVDTQPGEPFPEFPESVKYYDEAIVIALPDEASCISAVKMFKKNGEEGVKTSLVVNKISNRRYELSIREIEDMCENKVTGALPEDENVKVGVAQHTPIYLLNRKSPFSVGIDDIANTYSSRIYVTRRPAGDYVTGRGFMAMIRRIINAVRGG